MQSHSSAPLSPRSLNIGASSANYRRVATAVEQKIIADEFLATVDIKKISSEVLKDLGMTYNECSFYEKAIELLTLALDKLKIEFLEPNKKIQFESECLHGLANCQREYGNDDQAIKGYLDALACCKKITSDAGRNEIEYRIRRDLGIAYIKVNQFTLAQPCFEKAQRCAKASEKPGRFAPVKSYEGLAQALAKESPATIEAGFQKLYEARALYPDTERENSMDWAAHRYHMGRAYQAMEDQKSLTLALIEFAESLRLRKDMIPRQDIGLVYRNNRTSDSAEAAADVCLKLNLIQQAKEYLEIAIECYQELHKHFAQLKNEPVANKFSEKLRMMNEKILTIQEKALINLEEKPTFFQPAKAPSPRSSTHLSQPPSPSPVEKQFAFRSV